MAQWVRVHVDDDGNAVVPVGRALHGRDVDLYVEVVTQDGPPLPDRGPGNEVREFLAGIRNTPRPTIKPRAFTAAEVAARLAEFDALTGSWEGDFSEPPDPVDDAADAR